MSVNFIRAGWIIFYDNNTKCIVYCREMGSNEKETKILYGRTGDKVKTIRNKDIISRREDLYASDYKKSLGEIEEFKKDKGKEEFIK